MDDNVGIRKRKLFPLHRKPVNSTDKILFFTRSQTNADGFFFTFLRFKFQFYAKKLFVIRPQVK